MNIEQEVDPFSIPPKGSSREKRKKKVKSKRNQVQPTEASLGETNNG